MASVLAALSRTPDTDNAASVQRSRYIWAVGAARTFCSLFSLQLAGLEAECSRPDAPANGVAATAEVSCFPVVMMALMCGVIGVYLALNAAKVRWFKEFTEVLRTSHRAATCVAALCSASFETNSPCHAAGRQAL